ncbi:hypothetical protein HPP05_40795 [Corallococcus exiguus]|uniref:hypothetical protein n=2 Tax=Corallococcus TaxID=83461 RepID=UPI000EBD1E37|nr:MULTISPECIES: hypothetical protein [Corallococcus]NPC76085.1 hypothetical protein [Corallococcus exiguus]RKH96925.1 hypothetical protein D7Y04_27250 [Corallococcus sp. AB038B]
MPAPRARRKAPLWLACGLLPAALGTALGSGVTAHAAPPPPAPALEEGRVVDRVVAVIEGQVLTQSELEMEARVALIQRGAVQAAALPLDEQTLRGALELSINQRLQVLSADRLQAFPAEPAEVEGRLEAVRARLGGEAALQRFLDRHGVDRNALEAVLARGLRAERILDSRVRLKAQVSEAEVRHHYDAHRDLYPGEFDQAARTAIREELVRARYGELAAQALAEVRKSAQVRRVAPFAREARR